MRKIPLASIIKNQIRRELRRKEIIKSLSDRIFEQEAGLHLSQASNLSQDRLEQQILPLLSLLFKRRIINGGEPVKLSNETGLKLYVNSMVAMFDSEEEIVSVNGQEITLQAFTEDRWVYVYLNLDETFTVNKYPPFIGTNVDRIIICKVWMESNAITYSAGTIKDLRQVGVASANINHVLRQQFLHFMQAIPATIINSIAVVPYTYPSGDEPFGGSGLYVKMGSTNDKLFYARTNPIPDTIIEITLPEFGDTKNYYIVCSAQVDNYDPDDFTWNIKTIEDTETLEMYEIPVAIIKGVECDTVEITSSMIETIGYQKTQDDYFNYTLDFEYSKSDLGDMNKSIYDTDDDGVVDKAESLDDGVNTVVPSEIITSEVDGDYKKVTKIMYNPVTGNLKILYET